MWGINLVDKVILKLRLKFLKNKKKINRKASIIIKINLANNFLACVLKNTACVGANQAA